MTEIEQTDSWYFEQGGFSYTDEQVDRFLERWFLTLAPLEPGRRVLDLACGDGVWSFGLERLEPSLQILGVDLSRGAIESATRRAQSDGSKATFRCEDLECLASDLMEFDLVFARGLHIFNQHDMTHPGCLSLLEGLHERLAPNGIFYSTYGGRPANAGGYTPASDVRLPLNWKPRRTAALDFRGGKFNHTQESFLAPFLRLESVEISAYRYRSGRHALVTRRADQPRG